MSDQLVIRNARLVLSDEVKHGSLAISDGVIRAIGTDGGAGDASSTGRGVDLEGDYLLPGLVELHTDNFERHLMPRPKVFWPALLAH